MENRRSYNVGLFFGVMAALALGFGMPQATAAAQADVEMSVEQLTPEQQAALVEAAMEASPHVRLAVEMANQGYEEAEILERLAMLTDEEVAKLADEPVAMEAGAVHGAIVLAIIVVAVLILVIAISDRPAGQGPL